MMFLVISISAVVGFLAGSFAVIIATDRHTEEGYALSQTVPRNVSQDTSNSFTTIDDTITDVVQKSAPSVVSIIVTKDMPRMQSNPYGFFFGDPYSEDTQIFDRQEIGGGSGFFISENGMIVTNRHVVSDPEAQYTVITADGAEYDATVLGRDTITDFAVIDIEGDQKFPALAMGDSKALKVGQTAIAIGNSLGEFPNTVSRGIISGIGRDIIAGPSFGNGEQLSNIIQTDAAINPGNSGGPLLDINGMVIGINTAVAQGAQNIGFAIPINHVSTIIDQVQRTGTIERPFLGVRYVAITPEIASQIDGFDKDHGVLLLRGQRQDDLAVVPGSNADIAGLQENDVILEVDGTKIDEDHTLQELLLLHNVGDSVRVLIWRQSEILPLTITLSPRE